MSAPLLRLPTRLSDHPTRQRFASPPTHRNVFDQNVTFEMGSFGPTLLVLLNLPLLSLALTGCLSPFPQKDLNFISQPAPVDDKDFLPAYVRQCESVLGPVPEISCDPAHPAPGTEVVKIPVFVDGQLLGFGDTLSDSEQQLLAQRAQTGNYRCDFPSIGGDFDCAVGSTLVQSQSQTNPNVQWVGLCRGVPRDNPRYDRFIGNGLIGANVKTGEMCFFFGLNPRTDEPYTLPRLSSNHSKAAELAPWLAPKAMPGSCISCHPNNDPWIFTPWLQPPYMRGYLTSSTYPLSLPPSVKIDDVLAARIITPTPTEIQTMLPTPLPTGRTAATEEEILDAAGHVTLRQYRVVGSSYVDSEAKGAQKPRTGMKPQTWFVNFRERVRLKPAAGSCSNGCHAMGNEWWITMAHDSLGTHYSKYLSTQMSAGDLAGYTWMPQSAAGWSNVDDPNAFTIPAITECPIPKRLVGDVKVFCGAGSADVTWSYVNDFGGVPGRDDIRFDAAVVDSSDDTSGISTNSPLEGRVLAESPTVSVIQDLAAQDGVSYAAHVQLPKNGKAKLLLQPKRYCFEEPSRRPYAYAVPRAVDISVCQ